jgi:hypothetical protein
VRILQSACAGVGGATELHKNWAIIVVLNLAALPLPTPLAQCDGGFAGTGSRISTFMILVETLGELLKFVVNTRLPIGWLKQSITSLSRAVGIRLAVA